MVVEKGDRDWLDCWEGWVWFQMQDCCNLKMVKVTGWFMVKGGWFEMECSWKAWLGSVREGGGHGVDKGCPWWGIPWFQSAIVNKTKQTKQIKWIKNKIKTKFK
jgi:hypothetical protein